MPNTTRTQKEIILNALLSGKKLSSAQLANQYRISGYRARIRELREDGYPIYSNRAAPNGNPGRPRTTYRLGTPSRAMIGAAFRAAGASVFGN